MKRYRVLGFDFDTSATLLAIPIRDEWDAKVKQRHEENREKIVAHLIKRYGESNVDQKVQNLIELGAKSPSVLAYHNRFADQARTAFIMGAYYPALTAACTLGERILNHLILEMRDDFRHTPEYKTVYTKDSFENWDWAIRVLAAWGILLPEAATSFRSLGKTRNLAIHFRPEIDQNDRELALEAVHDLQDIIAMQFGAIGPQPWFIPDICGESYIRKDAEGQPFIRKVYIPNCYLVGPFHTLEHDGNAFIARDTDKYDDREISDDEFRQLRLEARRMGLNQ